METAVPPRADAAARLRYGALEILLYPGQALRIGRSLENDVVISDGKVSRLHAALEWNGTGFTLRDLGSANGTFVNGERIAAAERPLRDADLIALGEQSMRYELVRVEMSPPTLATAAITRIAGPMLRVASGPDQGQEYVLWGETVTIGRDSREATWEIRLSDRAVSRPHARLVREGSGFAVEDLESANGTFLNGAPLTCRAALNDGDAITLGSTRLVFSAS